ncbi:aldolase [Paenibacillus alkaliterrae]|uniref:aldolase n=1 Tax=Paenibacillus alkaliterrae TaxID=320909 RepID=UPI001F184CAC|nr:aldolase [Paenibacillus alkaliterrae]MCF2937402.1 aldolase [Paenibacillus alkaliterrae]
MKTETKVVYKAFGLTIISDIPFPELPRVNEDVEHVDIVVKMDTFLKSGFHAKPFEFVADDFRLTVQIPDVGVFRIQKGKEIVISPFAGADEDLIRLYLLGSCFGALLLQRGCYPLHGSAVAVNGKAYAFVGNSGAGKSTLASAFMEKGYQLLSDDVIAVSLTQENKTALVTPSYPQQKLWQQSLDAFGVSNSPFRSIYGRENKFCIPVAHKYCSSPLPLAGVFELVKTDAECITIQPVLRLERLHKLFMHTYRQYLIPKMNLSEWHFASSAALATVLPFYQITRSTKGFTAHQLVEMILNTIQKED